MSAPKAKIKSQELRTAAEQLSAAGLYQGCRLSPRIVPTTETSGSTIFLQIQRGCRHNKCLFCPFYKDLKFTEKPEAQIRKEVATLVKACADGDLAIRRVLLLDADGLDTEQDKLVRIMRHVRREFPSWTEPVVDVMPYDDAADCFYHASDGEVRKQVEISSFSHTETILHKGERGLSQLRDEGLGLIWWGIETGSEALLDLVKKGRGSVRQDLSPRERILEAGRILDSAKIYYVAIILVGLGGERFFEKHVAETTSLLKELRPPGVSYSDLVVVESTPYARLVRRGDLDVLSDERLREQRKIFEDLDLMVPQFDYEV